MHDDQFLVNILSISDWEVTSTVSTTTDSVPVAGARETVKMYVSSVFCTVLAPEIEKSWGLVGEREMDGRRERERICARERQRGGRERERGGEGERKRKGVSFDRDRVKRHKKRNRPALASVAACSTTSMHTTAAATDSLADVRAGRLR